MVHKPRSSLPSDKRRAQESTFECPSWAGMPKKGFRLDCVKGDKVSYTVLLCAPLLAASSPFDFYFSYVTISSWLKLLHVVRLVSFVWKIMARVSCGYAPPPPPPSKSSVSALLLLCRYAPMLCVFLWPCTY